MPNAARYGWKYSDYIASICAILIVMLRPSAFGEVYSLPIAASLVAAMILLLSRSNGASRPAERGVGAQLMLLVCIVLYEYVRTIFMVEYVSEGAIKSLLVDAIVLVTIFVVIRSGVGTKVFFDTLCIVVIAISASTAITLLLSFVVGVNNVPTVMRFNYTYADRGAVLFPFTFSFNYVGVGSSIVPRLSGIFREPGIMPAVSCWAAAYCSARRWHFSTTLLCLAGGAATLSSLGLPLTALTAAVLVVTRTKIPKFVSISIICLVLYWVWPILFELDTVGFGSKVESGSYSFTDRQKILFGAIDTENIVFGDGWGWSGTNIESIGLIGEIRIFGLPYVVAIICLFAMSASRLRFWMAGIAPLFVTCLASQPIALNPISLAILFSWVVIPPERPRVSSSEVTPLLPEKEWRST